MSSIYVTNISPATLWLRDLYVSIDPGQTRIVNRTPAEMGDMRGLQTYIDQGLVEVTVSLDSYEIKSELVAVWPLGLNWRPDVPTVVALNALPVAKNRLADLRIVTGTLVPYVWDGVAWVSMANFLGPPNAHASTHRTGGIDPITVDPTTATNNAAATGLTVNSATASVGATDPGHTHAINSSTATNNTASTGITLGNATPSIGAITMDGFYTLNTIEVPSTVQGTIDQTVASVAPTRQPGVPRPLKVTFPAAWAADSITINGVGRRGAVVSQTFAFPPGGGVVEGTTVFFSITSIVNLVPGGAPGLTASITLHDGYGVPQDNLVAFLKISIDGNADSFAQTDLVNGVFEPVGAHHGNHGVDVWYTYQINPSQSAHTHVVTDPSHNHTQNSHTHTANTASTGVTVADAGHSHGVTDPNHVHTQNGHAHNLS